ncbi:MAG: PorP/SprF family type IX secretion system membrane protein [Bacteroidetes bacterium]|nr:PorP/SprF family type IX secretion system membrane protein [Bacteroidota bacterium]MBT7143039.1 PorP/SprF family type IX secretion system membrane protein [Bacteroidota bacterium]MBT7492448.1 PorP/SprF family type IX secretion system membrane protein [Bacteroidota bacterium]
MNMLIFATIMALSQDIHFSQFNASPINLNPSNCGSFPGDFRLVANQRNQWKSITTPYKTFSTSLDKNFKKLNIRKTFFGAGFLVNSDKAGDGEFGTTQVNLSFAAHYKLKKDSSAILSFGTGGNIFQYSVNYDNFTFGEQYDGRFNSKLPTGEDFTKMQDNLLFFDVNVGLNLFLKFKRQNHGNIGISLNHINSPNVSFFSNENSIARKFVFHGNASLKLEKRFTLLPGFFIQNQNSLNEINIGSLVKYNLNNILVHSIYFGGYFRWKDALIVHFGLDYKDIKLQFSYDVNLSRLRSVSNGRGGLELSLIYIFDLSKNKESLNRKICPTFI